MKLFKDLSEKSSQWKGQNNEKKNKERVKKKKII